MVCNTVVFYDIENLISLFSVKNNTILQLDEIHRRILEVEGVSGISIQKAYGDWAVQINRNLRNYVLQIGIEPVQVFNTNQNDKVKNAADVSLIIDAVELLTRNPAIENYVIASGDGIFAFLAKKLHEHGKRVIGCGFDRNTNGIFRNACDVFINLEKTDKKLIATTKKNAQAAEPAAASAAAPVKTKAAPAPAKAKAPKPVKLPRRFPKNRFSEALSKGSLTVLKEDADLNDALLTIRDLVNTLFSGADKDADLEISVFKTYVDYYVPGFKMANYKFKRFNGFVRFLLTGSPYCLYAVEGGNVLKLIKRDGVGGKGTVMDDVFDLQVTLGNGTKTNSIFNVPGREQFSYTFSNAKKPVEKQKPAAKQKPERKTAGRRTRQGRKAGNKPAGGAAAEVAEDEDDGIDEGSIRKWIKEQFEQLSKENTLPGPEARRLTTMEYSQQTFGIKAPIFKLSDTRSNLREQRTVNGKVKYWKEFFKYNGKTYLVYKEWIASLHKDRFVAWLKKQAPKKPREKKAE